MKRLIFGETRSEELWGWKIKASFDSKIDPAFVYPEILAAAMNSVQTSRNRDPMPPRLVLHADAEELGDLHSTIRRYYDGMRVEDMKDIVKRFVTYAGLSPNYSGSKDQLLTRICSTNFIVVQNLSGTISEEIYDSVQQQLTIAETTVEDEEVFRLNTVLVTLFSLRDLQRACRLHCDIMGAFVELLRLREERLFRTHYDVNVGHRFYDNFKFKPSLFTLDNPELTFIPSSVDICKYHRIFIFLKSDVGEDPWKLVVLTPLSKTIEYFDPLCISAQGANDEASRAANLELLNFSARFEIALANRRQGAEDAADAAAWKAVLGKFESCFNLENDFDAGIYVFALVVYMSFSCPPIVDSAALCRWRTLFAYWLINKEIPDLLL